MDKSGLRFVAHLIDRTTKKPSRKNQLKDAELQFRPVRFRPLIPRNHPVRWKNFLHLHQDWLRLYSLQILVSLAEAEHLAEHQSLLFQIKLFLLEQQYDSFNEKIRPKRDFAGWKLVTRERRSR
jgi:hypothetical protein